MTENIESPRFTVNLEDLVALNDEITALVRAGVPLELGLRQIGSDVRGNLGRLAAVLGTRMSNGESLTEALEAEGTQFPPMYRAVVEAGIKAGRLPAALEAVTRYAQSLLEVHRRVSLACAYPFIVFVAAYSLLLLMLTEMIPRFDEMFTTFRMQTGWSLRFLVSAAKTMPYWGPVIPTVLFLAVIYWAFFQRRTLFRTGALPILFRCFPWASGIARNLRIANFSELLSLLTSHNVPLHTGLLLAAKGTGSRAIIHDSEAISVKLQNGDSLGESVRHSNAFPPYLLWLIQNGEQQGALTSSLKRAAEVYRARAIHQLESLKIILPLLIVVVVGGGATFLYAFTLFAPLVESLRSLALP